MLAHNRLIKTLSLTLAIAVLASCGKKAGSGDAASAGAGTGTEVVAAEGATADGAASEGAAAQGSNAQGAAVAGAGAAGGVVVAGADKPKGLLNRIFGIGGGAAKDAAKSGATGAAVGVGVGVGASVPAGGGGLAHNPMTAPATGTGAGAAKSGDAPVKPTGPADTCFTVSFDHKKMRSHSDDEDCGRHKNLLTLPHAVKGMTGLCVRVNGQPVQYQTVKGKADQLLIGPVAGPTSKITARYCVGKVQCTEECQIPKDEFMDAIGGSNDGELSAKAGQWDPADAKIAGELNKELAEVEQISAGASHGTYVFSDWQKGEEGPACSGGRAIASVTKPQGQ